MAGRHAKWAGHLSSVLSSSGSMQTGRMQSPVVCSEPRLQWSHVIPHGQALPAAPQISSQFIWIKFWLLHTLKPFTVTESSCPPHIQSYDPTRSHNPQFKKLWSGQNLNWLCFPRFSSLMSKLDSPYHWLSQRERLLLVLSLRPLTPWDFRLSFMGKS